MSNLTDIGQALPRSRVANDPTAGKTPRSITQPHRVKKACWAVDDPYVMPPGLKVQRGPGALLDARYQVNPSARVVGGFQSAGPGIDALTGRPWA